MSEDQTPGPQPLIELRDVTKVYTPGGQTVTVLHGVSLKIYNGEFVAIMGQSGSGKTTLMNIIGCLDRPSGGQLLFAGDDISRFNSDKLALLRRHAFGFIFQRYNLIAMETAEENVQIPAVYAGIPQNARLERARQLLAKLGLAERTGYRPNQLSGGQQQRVSIARALMNGGQVILADEPTGALDSASGADVMNQLRELHQAGHTIILITHDPNVARAAQRVIQIKDGKITSDTGEPKDAKDVDRAVFTREEQEQLLPDIVEAVKMAVRALRVNVFRTALTLLGIIIGVGAVVTMLALGDGSKQAVMERIEAMGTDLMMVNRGGKGVRLPEEAAVLMPDDAAAIGELPNVAASVPEFTKNVTVRAQGQDDATKATTTSAQYAEARNWPVAYGTFFTEADVASYAPVVVLGKTVADNLFPQQPNPVGMNVVIANVPFQVVGVLAPKGATASGSDMDDAVFLPLTTGRMRLFGKPYLDNITVKVADVTKIDATQQSVFDLLEKRHRKVDFNIRNMKSLMETATETQNNLTILLGSIAAISLLVGGIGVMNIMLVSVTERVREIGIRMATGARMMHIQLQFLTEALVVCSLGGLIGVSGGLAAAWIAQLAGSPVVYSATPVLLAFGSAFSIGLLFGFLPARRAARLDPVVALSSE
jgi:macrolide transport system ATP-binding/permease protein